jgi:hypothetical protein
MKTAEILVLRGTALGPASFFVFGRYCLMSKSVAPLPPDAGKAGILQQEGRGWVLPRAGIPRTPTEVRPAGRLEGRKQSRASPGRTSPLRVATLRAPGEAR